MSEVRQDSGENVFPTPLKSKLEQSGFVAVLVIDDLSAVEPLTEALLAGGISAIELTLRTPVALDALRIIKANYSEMTCGVGTLLRPEQVGSVLAAGADFAVAPGLNPHVVQEAIQQGLPFSPGIMTPTEIEQALELGCRFLKFFPADSAGGLKHLKTMGAPFAHLNVQYLPLGGISPKNLEEYLLHPWVDCAGGSWIAPQKSIQTQDWQGIQERARAIRGVIDRVRGSE